MTWDVSLDAVVGRDDWSIGLILGPSGSGKSTIARELFGAHYVDPATIMWSDTRSILDAFPADLGIAEITALFGAVGFSSPPSWLRPFGVLSTGEQFRATMARALTEGFGGLVVVDEFTSTVDRTVAQVASHCVAKAVRRKQFRCTQFVGVSCHYDIVDWLQPDWIYEPALDILTRRAVQRRPPVAFDVVPVRHEAWRLFAPHHYLTRKLARSARCFCAVLPDGRPVAFDGVLPMPSGTIPHAFRSSRRVTLPDFQGLGLGPALGDIMGSLHAAIGRRYYEHPTHPALIRARALDPKWRSTRKIGSFSSPDSPGDNFDKALRKTRATDRWVGGFEYVGPPHADAALARALLAAPDPPVVGRPRIKRPRRVRSAAS